VGGAAASSADDPTDFAGVNREQPNLVSGDVVTVVLEGMGVRRKLAVAVALLVLLGGGIWLFWNRARNGASDPRGGTPAEIVARKRAARLAGPVPPMECAASGTVKRRTDGSPIAGAIVTLTPSEVDSETLPSAGAGP